MSATAVQAWIAVIGGLITAVVGVLGFLRSRTRRDYFATVGASFSSTVDSLSDENVTKQIAAAVLLRRFFDPHTEQGSKGLAYKSEAVNVIAGMLRNEHDDRLQKALADGLRYAKVLAGVDLQQCNLKNAYLGRRLGDTWTLDLSDADFYDATLDGASLRAVVAFRAVFFHASLKDTVFEEAQLAGADFRQADLAGARFGGATIEGARFAEAIHVPPEISALLDENGIARSAAPVAT